MFSTYVLLSGIDDTGRLEPPSSLRNDIRWGEGTDMDTEGDHLDDYPGMLVPATTSDFEALKEQGRALGMRVTLQSGGSFFIAAKRWINVDTKTPTRQGFVGVSQLTDEYLHAWNQVHGRGKYLDAQAAAMHRRLGTDAERFGTKVLLPSPNRGFHKLEALNFLQGSNYIPSFVWRTPKQDLRAFAESWFRHFQF